MQIELENGRIWRNDYKGGRSHQKLSMQWDRKPFIAWDGEGTQPTIGQPGYESFSKKSKDGKRNINVHVPNPIAKIEPIPQPYVLFGNSEGEYITNEEGVSTKECLDLLLEEAQILKDTIFVGFGLNYDFNQILKDLPKRTLTQIHKTNTTHWQGYKIQWYPGKWLYVKRKNQKVRLFDVFSFFQSSFLVACEKFLGTDHPDYLKMKEGKAQRSVFTFDQLDYIIDYYSSELRLLVQLMNALRTDLHNAGIDLSSWHGPGAVASTVFKQSNIRRTMAETPEEVNNASQYAYAGGRFEQFYCGRHSDPIYEYDINSAYPSAITQLPNLRTGTWERTNIFQPGSFGIWYIEFNKENESGGNDAPQPLFCRSKGGLIAYPYKTNGWFWTPEAIFVADRVQYGWVFKETGERPFSFVREMYEKRKEYKANGNSTERALKLALNSMYGKMAQRIGYRDRIPTWHQLEWAGFITSYTRGRIYEAVLQNPQSILAIETDALFTTEPLELPLSNNLGDWEETVFSEISYLQSGFYYAIEKETNKVICKYRGLDKTPNSPFPNSLPYKKVMKHLSQCGAERGRGLPLASKTTRFNGLGLALNTHAVWRAWETNKRYLAIGGDEKGSKRAHGATCIKCADGMNMYDTLHPCHINGYSGDSYPHNLPWVEENNEPQILDYEMMWQ